MAQSQVAELTHDIFISYSRKNRDWVHGFLLPSLEQAELKCIIDEHDFVAGVPTTENIDNAILGTRHTVVVLSPD